MVPLRRPDYATFAASVRGAYVKCTCEAILQTTEAIRDHWQQGHFDYVDPDPLRADLEKLVAWMRAEEQRLCRQADGQGLTQYAERLAAKADAFGRCADRLAALL